MGFKRPIEDEDFHEFPFKHPKQVDLGNNLTLYTQNLSNFEETLETGDPACEDDGLFFKLQCDGPDTSEDDSGSGPATRSYFSPEYFEFHFPRRALPPFKDIYSLSLDGPPRKQVPIGADHQVEVPEWEPQAICSSESHHIVDFDGEKLMGDCVYPLPDLELSSRSDDLAGNGRQDCKCPDQGSLRCAQQHVREARERLRVDLGPEKFLQLGFCDMGEEVSLKWTAEEAQVFHEVVYTNGKNFWAHLSCEFPSRTKSEIVSYYFNVFMLRRRSIQNRSKFLDIDSDDDEWHLCYWGPIGIEDEEAEEDDIADSPLDDEDIGGNCEDGCPNNNGDGKDNNKGDCKVVLPENGAESANGWDPSLVLEPCNGKVWDDSFAMSPLKFVDLLPTGKMIEEIFGPCNKNNGPASPVKGKS